MRTLVLASLALLACVSFAGATYAAAQCNPKAYGFEECPNDVQLFLDNLDSCHKGAKNPSCQTLGCDFDDLMRKYHGQEKMVQLIEADMDKIIGKNANFSTACK